MKKEVEDEIKRQASKVGKNHLNSKINELIELHGDLISGNVTKQSEILKIITDRISTYQEIVKGRYL